MTADENDKPKVNKDNEPSRKCKRALEEVDEDEDDDQSNEDGCPNKVCKFDFNTQNCEY